MTFRYKYFIDEIIIVVVFLLFIFNFSSIEQWLTLFMEDYKTSVEWSPLTQLAGEYILVVLISSSISFILSFSLGSLIHIYELSELESLLLLITDFATTFPTVAVIALFVPIFGYGVEPVVAALVLYGLLPIFANTIKGLEEVDEEVVQAAIGMGMSRWELFYKVELPLASQVIIAGVRTSVIINIAAATVGATVGAGGLGMPIVSGIRTNEPMLIIKGTVPVALIALIFERLFYRLENRYKWQ